MAQFAGAGRFPLAACRGASAEKPTQYNIPQRVAAVRHGAVATAARTFIGASLVENRCRERVLSRWQRAATSRRSRPGRNASLIVQALLLRIRSQGVAA